jgi:hypothetical protein
MNEKEKEKYLAYCNGFMACIVYQYYMSLPKEQQELWNDEREEMVVEQYVYLLEENEKFLEETMRKGVV